MTLTHLVRRRRLWGTAALLGVLAIVLAGAGRTRPAAAAPALPAHILWSRSPRRPSTSSRAAATSS